MLKKWRRWFVSLLAGLLILGLGGWALFIQPLSLLTSLSPLICPNAIYAVDTREPVVALTLDDGPDISTTVSQSTTTQILDLLNRHQAQATFFLTSNKLKTPVGAALTQRIVDEGHELGNHFTEDIRSITDSPEAFTKGLLEAEETLASFSPSPQSSAPSPKSPALSQISQKPHPKSSFQSPASLQDQSALPTSPKKRPSWFRPAGGWCSQSNAQTTQTQGYQTVLGNIWPYDTHMHSVGLATQQILRTAQPGSIIILHDAGKVEQGEHERDRGQRTVQILSTVLPELKNQGYRVVTLSELARYGTIVQNTRTLPPFINRIWQRAIAGGLGPSLTQIPSVKQWGTILLTSIVGITILLWLGFKIRFLRYRWANPGKSQTRAGLYSQIIFLTFFFPALVEEFIFRLVLLPSPREITDVISRGQWIECAVSLILYVAVHPLLNGPLRDRIGQHPQTHPGEILSSTPAYAKTFRRPSFLLLTTVLGMICSVLYLLFSSVWPPILLHWAVVAGWLLGLGGYSMLHPD